MFLNELSQKLSMQIDDILGGFRVTNVNNKAVIIDAKAVIDIYNSCKIVLSVKRHKIFVYGNNMTIVDYGAGQTVIKGNIICISDREVNL